MPLDFPANPNTGDKYACWEWDGVKWVFLPEGGVYIGASAPPDPGTGQLWLNTTTEQLSIWDGTNWILVSGGGASVGTTPPAGPNTGDFFYNTTTGKLFIWNGSAWVNAGNITTVAGTAPSNPSAGDGWVNTASGNALSIWNGTTWVAVDTGGNTNITVGTTPPGTPAAGDLFYNTTTNQLSIWNGSSWVTVSGASVTFNTTAPANPNTGNFWFNPATNQMFAWNGTSWVRVSGVSSTVGTTAPATPISGDFWYNTTTGRLNIWDGTAWQVAGGAGASVGSTAPSTPNSGDLWYNTTNNSLMVWNGSTWVPSAKSITINATAPASPNQGDLWWDLTDGRLYIWDGGASSIWVGVSAPAVGPMGPQGPQGAPGSIIPDAPSDSGIYGRQNGAWAAVTPFPEAPTDGRSYGRVGQTESWNPVLPLAGGNLYAVGQGFDGIGFGIENQPGSGQAMTATNYSGYYFVNPGGIPEGPTPPPSPVSGDLWWDTSLSIWTLGPRVARYDGSNWWNANDFRYRGSAIRAFNNISGGNAIGIVNNGGFGIEIRNNAGASGPCGISVTTYDDNGPAISAGAYAAAPAINLWADNAATGSTLTVRNGTAGGGDNVCAIANNSGSTPLSVTHVPWDATLRPWPTVPAVYVRNDSSGPSLQISQSPWVSSEPNTAAAIDVRTYWTHKGPLINLYSESGSNLANLGGNIIDIDGGGWAGHGISITHDRQTTNTGKYGLYVFTRGILNNPIAIQGDNTTILRLPDNATVSWTPPSDVSLKENMAPVKDDVLSMLCKVPIESFDWKAGGHENVGWVAQHVGEILPEWIKSDRDLQRVDPDNSGLPYIIRAFQQVVERLEKLEKK